MPQVSCFAGSTGFIIAALAAHTAVAQPASQTCPDGSVIAISATCPADPEPGDAVRRSAVADRSEFPAPAHRQRQHVARGNHPGMAAGGIATRDVREPEITAPVPEPAGSSATTPEIATSAPVAETQPTKENQGVFAALSRWWLPALLGLAGLAAVAIGIWFAVRKLRQRSAAPQAPSTPVA